MSDSTSEDYWAELSISEIANLLHISQSALRYYEEQGLVTPSRTEKSGYRKYSVLSLVELTDIMLYRSVGVPVKTISHLMESPIGETAAAVDQALDETIEQLANLNKTLKLLSLYNRRIRKFYTARSHGDHLVDRPEIDELYRFGMKNEASLQAYLDDLKTSYALYFESALQSEQYVDCAIKPVLPDATDPLWKRTDKPQAYLECLLRTEYCFAQHNDLADHVAYLRSLGKEPGRVVAKYLTFDYSEADRQRYDYYLAWIEVR